MTQVPARGPSRRLVSIALVPLALLATVQLAHADTLAALAGLRLFAPPSPVQHEADALRRDHPADAALLDRIAQQPTALWVGGWVRDLRGEVNRVVSLASGSGAVPVLVAYNIPNRDCGGHSAGGDRDADSYRRWIRDFAAGLHGRRAIVVLEPDALGHLDCLSPAAQDERLELLRDAVGVLKDNGANVYVDAGNARWVKPDVMAGRLRRAALDRADGFALNVSNFIGTAENVRYGERIAALTGDKHFLIDTSRNGVGGNGDWCNPAGQGLGAFPTTETGHPLVDAFLWVKAPGQSDGPCNGGPAAGTFWRDYALTLARNQPQQYRSPVRLASAAR